MSGPSAWNLTAQLPAGIEWIIILLIFAILLLFGPQKLPELARGVGKALGEFRRGRMEVERQIRDEMSEQEMRDVRQKVERAASALGVSSAGRSEMQLKIEIARAVDKATDSQVVAAAQAIGVYSSGSDVQRLKEQIVKSLNV